MKYVLDTNVLSELRKPHGDRNVKHWVNNRPTTEFAVSVVTIIEIELGILRRERQDPAQARALRTWFENQVLTGFADRILPLDLAAARRVAPLHVPDQAPQHEALIAGTALSRSLTVVSRNTSDFERVGVLCFNPWTAP